MIRYLSSLMFLIVYQFSSAQQLHYAVEAPNKFYSCDSSGRKEVVIIGTVHQGNKLFNADSLKEVLCRINPDVILKEEVNINLSLGHRIVKILGFLRESIERKATIWYRKKYGTKVVSYDLVFDRTKYLKEAGIVERKIWASIDSLYKENRLTSEQRLFIDEYNRSHDFFWKYVKDSSLERLNQKSVIDSSRKFMELFASNIYPIIEHYEPTKEHASYAKGDLAFWHHRNIKMAENILKQIENAEGKRIVILTGLLHKYYLLDLLKPRQEQYCFLIYEYWRIHP